MIDILGALFGGTARVRIMRLFIFNPSRPFEISDIRKRASVSVPTIRREMKTLLKSKFVKPKIFFKTMSRRKKGTNVQYKKKLSGFIFNETFPFAAECQTMLMAATPLRGNSIVRRFSRAGRLKLLVTSGVFLQEPESRLDLMIVGDRLNKGVVDRTVRSLEGEIGKELRYAVFETPDFNYRLSVYDRLVRDVLDYPHQKLLDKMGVGGEE